LWLLSQPLAANAPKSSVSVNYNDLFVKTMNIPSLPEKWLINANLTQKKAIWKLFGLAEEKYPDYVDLLMCLAEKESGFDQYAIGDNGKAHSWYQIHYLENGITKECAYDLECATDFVIREIRAGNSWKWTSYPYCKSEEN